MSVETLPVFDFVVERGRSVSIELGPVTEKDVAGVRQPVDLTAPGTMLWLTVKADHDDADASAVIQLTEADGITVDSPASAGKNFATAFIPEATFADPVAYATRTTLVWDAVWELGTRHETLARGRIVVVPSVTRAT